MIGNHLKGLVGGSVPKSAEELAAWLKWNRATKVLGDKLVTEGLTRADYPGTDEGWQRLVDFDALINRLRAKPSKPDPAREPDHRRIPDWAWRGVMDLDETDITIRATEFVGSWHSLNRPRKGLLLHGTTGTGKTAVAAAIAHDCDPGAFWPMRELARRARDDAMGPGGLIPTLITRPLLVVDDVGVERTEFQRDVFREIVEGRADRGGLLILTTNLTPKELADQLGERCWSRLHAMVSSVALTGRDRRLPEVGA